MFTYKAIKIYENHIWELRGEEFYERRPSAVVDATFAFGKRKPFASITAMIFFQIIVYDCIVCITT